jgi:acylaminoacyl-peptidase
LDKRPITLDDLCRIRTASDPQMAPDGSRVAFVLKTVDVDKNKNVSHLWVVPAAPDAGPPRQWTHGLGSENTPRWSPDGRFLAFTSGREEKKEQIFLLPVRDGGEAERVTDLPPGGIGHLAWSPDGDRLAFTFRAQDEDRREDAVEERKKAERSAPPREITRLHYREEGAGFVPAERYRLHVLDITARTTTVLPLPTDRDCGTFCWSPDGTRIAYVMNAAEDPDLLPSAEDLFVIPVAGAEEAEEGECQQQPVKLSCPSGPKENLAWSPDGAHIAFLGHDKADEVWGVTNLHPWVVPAEAGTDDDAAAAAARDLVPFWDVHCGSAALGDVVGGGESGPFWSADGRSLLLLASDRGTVDVYRIAVGPPADGEAAGGLPKRLTEGTHAITGFTGDAKGENLALLLATPTDAGDLYALSPGSSFFRRLTRLNQELLDEVDPSVPRYFEAPSPEGHAVPCWALFPPDHADDPRPRPTIVYLHGGPHLMYAHALFHEYQALAGAGYVVLYPNPRGSKGYGEAWTGAIRGNWGEPAHTDVLACVDHAVEQAWSDPARLGVAGGSYGGYLAAWIVGHTDRFAAAVAERGVFNLHSMAGTCDFLWKDRGYFDANTWDDPAEYLRNSPLTYADAITTPLLIVHSEGDLRCPIEQAEQFYAALKRQRKDVVFLRYGPEANHNLSRGGPPDLRLDRQRRIRDWFDRRLKGDAPAPAPVGAGPIDGRKNSKKARGNDD